MITARLFGADGSELAGVEVATTAWQRARGLLGRAGLRSGTAMWLAPCRSIHTVGMQFAIDVVFIDREGRITRLRERVGPFRLVWGGWRAHGVLEFAAGEVARLRLTASEPLRLVGLGDQAGGQAS